jgi:hypothetical protein
MFWNNTLPAFDWLGANHTLGPVIARRRMCPFMTPNAKQLEIGNSVVFLWFNVQAHMVDVR